MASGRQGRAVAEFSAAEAAFVGFRIVRERPLSVIFWAALQFVVSLAATLFVTVSAGPAFSRFMSVGLQPISDPAPLVADAEALAPTFLVLALATLVFYAVIFAAMNRAVLRPQAWRFGYLRLAADELRQLGLFALLAGGALALYLVIVVVAAFVFTLLSLLMGGAGVGTAQAILIVGVIGAAGFFGVRFSLAPAMTFATGRINLMGSWAMTRGRFRPLLGTYLLALALGFVVQALTLAIAIFTVAVLVGGMKELTPALASNMSSIAAALTPPRLVYLAFTAIGSALSFPVTIAPPAAIYKALTGASSGGRGFD